MNFDVKCRGALVGLVVAASACHPDFTCEEMGNCVGATGATTSYAPTTEESSRGETTSSRVAESTESSREGGAPSSGLSGASSGTSGETLSDTSSCDGEECPECVVGNNDGCSEERPFCIAEESSDGGVEQTPHCVQCIEDFDCRVSGAGELCEGGACLPCELATHRGCGGELPYCVGGATGNPSAPDADASVSDVSALPATEGPRCAECLTEADCGGETPACVNHACVACDRDAQCTEPGASVCDSNSHTCVACSAVGECAHLPGTPACDVEGGRCVECTREESEACGSRVCNVLVESEGYQTCSGFDEGETIQCGECVNDAQCAEGFRCVPEAYKVPSSDAGVEPTGKYYCMALERELLELKGRTCSTNRPFVGAFEATSEGGETGRYCRPQFTTCAAYMMHRNGPDLIPEGQPGAGDATCLSSDSCGLPGVNDGYCVELPNSEPPTNRCTYECASDDDCNVLPAAVSCVTATTWDGEQRKVCSVTSNN